MLSIFCMHTAFEASKMALTILHSQLYGVYIVAQSDWKMLMVIPLEGEKGGFLKPWVSKSFKNLCK